MGVEVRVRKKGGAETKVVKVHGVKVHAVAIRMVPLADIKLNPNNRNKHPADQVARLAELYRYHGMRQALTVSNQSGLLVAGEGRWLAAQAAGLDEVPVSFQDFDSPEQEYAYGVADNGISEWAELDLSAINMDLQELGPDFDLNMLGLQGFVLEPADIAYPDLPQGDKSDMEQITFTLTSKQAEAVRASVEQAAESGPFGDTGNENKNGNAIARVAEAFLAQGIE